MKICERECGEQLFSDTGAYIFKKVSQQQKSFERFKLEASVIEQFIYAKNAINVRKSTCNL